MGFGERTSAAHEHEREQTERSADRIAATAGSAPPLSRSWLLDLQRRAGNQTVGRLLQAGRAVDHVQRLALSENPVDAKTPPLTNIKQLMGGHKGELFRLDNPNQKLVVKFQNEPVTEPVLGTHIMKKAGARTPGIRTATPPDLDNISTGLTALEKTHTDLVAAYGQARGKLKNSLLMDFAEGQTPGELLEKAPEKLMAALQSPQLQDDLGRLLAADAFSGNPDRAMAVKGFNEDFEVVLMGWFHEGNFFIGEDEGKFTATAIDNAFAPTLFSEVKPYGVYHGGAGFQFGSTAAANREYFTTEVGHIFDRFVKELEARQADTTAFKTSKPAFVDRVVASGSEAMAKLLQRGQGWKGQLREGGADEGKAGDFGARKRYLRLIKAGVDPEKAHELAKDQQQYRTWVLTNQDKVPEEEAKQILAEGTYKERRNPK